MDVHEFIEQLRLLFDEYGDERQRVPFIVKELAARLKMRQRNVKALLVEARPLTVDWLYYEGASQAVLVRNRHTRLCHYILVDGIWRSSIVRL